MKRSCGCGTMRGSSFLSLATLCLFLGLAVTARADTWTPYKTLRDTAADAIDFTWKKECPSSTADECRLVWKFLNRYQKPVRLTWRVVYRTKQGSRELLNETTVPPGESPEFDAVGETLETAQVGVPRDEVRAVGVTALSSQSKAGRADSTDHDLTDDEVDYSGRLREFTRRHEERTQQLADSFAETRDLLKRSADLFGPAMAEAELRAADKAKPKGKKKK